MRYVKYPRYRRIITGPLLRSIVMAGGSTVVAYFRSQSPLDYEFAAHKRSNEIMESPFSNVRVTPNAQAERPASSRSAQACCWAALAVKILP